MEPFARKIGAAKKYVVSSTLDRVDWNAKLVRGDLGRAVQQLKRTSGKGLFVGGVKLPLALAELGLIDDYEFVVHPRLAGHGPTLFAGLPKCIDLKLVGRLELGSGPWRCGMSREGSHSFYRAAGGGLAVLHLECEFVPPNNALERTVDQRGRIVRAMNCVLADAQRRRWSAARLGRSAAQ
jgi:hypothetical protein